MWSEPSPHPHPILTPLVPRPEWVDDERVSSPRAPRLMQCNPGRGLGAIPTPPPAPTPSPCRGGGMMGLALIAPAPVWFPKPLIRICCFCCVRRKLVYQFCNASILRNVELRMLSKVTRFVKPRTCCDSSECDVPDYLRLTRSSRRLSDNQDIQGWICFMKSLRTEIYLV